ncbi:MAG: M23 family metallopeptidase [Nitriliruptoraceae bacterium]
MSAPHPRARLPVPVGVRRALTALTAIAAAIVGGANAAVADPADNVEELSGQIAAVEDELAELAEAFAVLDVREAEVRRHLERATSRVDRLAEQRTAAKALHRTQLDLAHRRTTVEQVDEALHTLAMRSGVAGQPPDHGTTWPEDRRPGAATTPEGGPQTATVREGGPHAATSVSLRTPSSATAVHLQLRYVVRASLVLATLHRRLDEAEQATAAPRRELDAEVAPARAQLQERLQELLAERTELANSLAFERSMLERSDRLQLPVTGAHRVSSRFGMRRHPIHGDVRMHTGLDLAAPIGTPVSTAAAGRVVAAGSRGGYGLTVDVDHGDGLLTRYAHLDRIDVARGDRLTAGQRLGTVGMTGTVTGPHLHLEVREHGQAVDPADWLRGAGGRT